MNWVDEDGKLPIAAMVIGGLIAADIVTDWIATEEESFSYDPETESGTLSEAHTITPIVPIQVDIIINSNTDGTTDGQLFIT